MSVVFLYWTALTVQHVGGVIQAGMVIWALERGSYSAALVSAAFLLFLARKDIPKPDHLKKRP